MRELRAGDQVIRYDREATAAIYAKLASGWAERCRCPGCSNFIPQRASAYPTPFLAMLDQLGIDPAKEGEIVANGPLPNGLHHYSGWFFLAGEMIAEGERIVQVSESPYFAYFFTRGGPSPPEFRAGPYVRIEFMAHFKWVLPGEEQMQSPARNDKT